MGNFGAAVTSLLDTYSKCLRLLKQFGGSGDASREDASASTQLRTSLRSDRSRVRDAYLSRLEHHGCPFDEGDARSRSRLRRLVKRLIAALASVTGSLGHNQPVTLDVQSLVALSESSSRRAVRTMDSLSSRVSSQGSLTTSKTSRSSKASTKSSQKRRLSGTDKRRRPSRSENSKARGNESSSGRKDRPSQNSQSPSRKRSLDAVRRNPHRASYLTMSSDSTQLGEVRRKWSISDASDHSRLHRRPHRRPPRTVMYPIRSASPDSYESRKKWWGIFGG